VVQARSCALDGTRHGVHGGLLPDELACQTLAQTAHTRGQVESRLVR